MANYGLTNTASDGTGAWSITNGPAPMTSTVVASLPSAAANTGKQFLVTDATLSPILGLGLAAVGSGANTVRVWSNGTSWLIG